jgi:hypothetical protein
VGKQTAAHTTEEVEFITCMLAYEDFVNIAAMECSGIDCCSYRKEETDGRKEEKKKDEKEREEGGI